MLHEHGSKGLGILHSILITAPQTGLSLKSAKVGVEGFGNVGTYAVKFMTGYCLKVVSISDGRGTIYNADEQKL